MKRKQQATTSGEDYLEAILVLQMQKGTVRSVAVSYTHLDVYKRQGERCKLHFCPQSVFQRGIHGGFPSFNPIH